MENLKNNLKILLSDSFDKELVDYAFRNLEDKTNLIRLNNFSYVLRELLYRILEREAPHKEVSKSPWFKSMIKWDKTKATREQQMQYMMLDKFPNDFVNQILKIDVKAVAEYLNGILNSMNAYTHISPKTTNYSDKDIESKVGNVCALFTDLFGLIRKIQNKIYDGVAKRIDRELLETMYMETFDEVDILSTHSTIEEYSIQDLTIERITDRDLKCDVQGFVTVRLQYGSNYDIRNDDGYVTDMTFPFNSSFTCTLTEEGIENYVIEQDSIDFDTSSFYE
jgi:conserved hypothetical protein